MIHGVDGLSQRIAQEIRTKIECGEWPVGARLPTTRALASRYGVSANTIQTAFRSLEADELVERRPRVGGYVKARYRRASALRTLTTIAVVGPYSDTAFAAAATNPDEEWGYRIIRGMEVELAPSGFHISNFSYLFGDQDALRKTLEKIDQAGNTLGGVFCFMNAMLEGLPEELDRRNIPWVALNRPTQYAAYNFVAHDVFRGSRLIARCLARMGVDRVAILADPLVTGRSTGDKLFGFLQGWLEAGMASQAMHVVSCAETHEQAGRDLFLQYLEKHGTPRAVFAAGDFLALGVIRACRDLGLSVPEQVSVIGSTGLQLAAYSHPSLTVLGTPMEQIGSYAAQMLLEMAREGVRRMAGRYAKAQLTIRESCPIPADVLEHEQAAMDRSR